MRYQSWLLLCAGLLVVSQSTYSADGRGVPATFPGHYSPAAINENQGWVYQPRQPVAATRSATSGQALTERAPGYRFRPWQRPTAGLQQGAPSAAPAVLSRYRFRPMPPAQQVPVEQPVRYRPLQIRIPDRYVFRPLKPTARQRPPLPDQSPSGFPPVSRHLPGGAYSPYVYNPYASWPNFPYAAGNHHRVPWTNARRAYPMPGWTPPRHGYPSRFAQGLNRPPRVRNWPYPVRYQAPRSWYPPRYAWRQPLPPAPPPVAVWPYGRGVPLAPYPTHGVWQRTAQRPPPPPARFNRYGTDWYDGRSDGDGAWYRLVLESEPTVSQFWAPPPVTSEWID